MMSTVARIVWRIWAFMTLQETRYGITPKIELNGAVSCWGTITKLKSNSKSQESPIEMNFSSRTTQFDDVEIIKKTSIVPNVEGLVLFHSKKERTLFMGSQL